MRAFLNGTTMHRVKLLLFLTGAFCALYFVFIAVEAASAKRASEVLVGQANRAGSPADPETVAIDTETTGSKKATVMGRLMIPALALRVPIMSDYQSSSLLKGIGYIPGTARPGGLGTLGLAGHRDTYFKPLRGIKRDMDIQVADASGVYHYQVDSTEIVTPDQVRVLAIGSQPALTLITCYPFSYIGAAPKRFIVHAHLLSALPDEN